MAHRQGNTIRLAVAVFVNVKQRSRRKRRPGKGATDANQHRAGKESVQ
ncbi:MAG: hypothetical protein ACI88C_002621 [Acidimicrobiales bacterium]